MDADQMALLQEIQAYEFTCLDLNLYLDTHPWDENALADYNAASEHLSHLMEAYSQHYGALTHCGHEQAAYPWSWICEPWPWEIDY